MRVLRLDGARPATSRLVGSLLFAIAPWLVLSSVIAAVLVLIGFLLVPSTRRDDLWFEIGKAGIQLFVIVILGGVIGVILRSLDAMREDERRLQEYLVSLGRELIDAYNAVKGVRRTLRAFGFRSPTSGKLSGVQVAEFHEQMGLLDEARRDFERIDRELEIRGVFDDPEAVQRQLSTMHRYIGDITRDWEQARGSIVPGVKAGVIGNLRHLQAFLGPPESGLDNVSRPMREIQKTIRLALVPEAASRSPESGSH